MANVNIYHLFTWSLSSHCFSQPGLAHAPKTLPGGSSVTWSDVIQHVMSLSDFKAELKVSGWTRKAFHLLLLIPWALIHSTLCKIYHVCTAGTSRQNGKWTFKSKFEYQFLVKSKKGTFRFWDVSIHGGNQHTLVLHLIFSKNPHLTQALEKFPCYHFFTLELTSLFYHPIWTIYYLPKQLFRSLIFSIHLSTRINLFTFLVPGIKNNYIFYTFIELLYEKDYNIGTYTNI